MAAARPARCGRRARSRLCLLSLLGASVWATGRDSGEITSRDELQRHRASLKQLQESRDRRTRLANSLAGLLSQFETEF